MLGLLNRLFGSNNDRQLTRLRAQVSAINDLEARTTALSDHAIKVRIQDLRTQAENGAALDHLLIETFALVRVASERVLRQRPYDVQMIGGIALHQGMVVEMKTGEGKTLAATLPVTLNALSGAGVHVVTVNDYLVRRDAAWMGQIYDFLGLSVGAITPGLDDLSRRQAYAATITYATNNELGFDYLRDNMKIDLAYMVQRPPNYAIVDEVDSILIDEARTPLIISGQSEAPSALYHALDGIVQDLAPEHYEKDEKLRTVTLSEDGSEHCEQVLQRAELLPQSCALSDPQALHVLHHLLVALRAHVLFQRDRDYIIKDDQLLIIDEFTGRVMAGRRYGEGLHQALEAKEGVSIQEESQTLASVTFQNYFRLYPKLAGMTGTALTEASEFQEIYGMRTIAIPTHLPCVRADHDDEIFCTQAEKTAATVALIRDCHERAQPVLVGTVSIEKSEQLAQALAKIGITHQVLNARYHEQEAMIIAQAGRPGAVTIATNMAGRGTDIQLGGAAADASAPEPQVGNAQTVNAQVGNAQTGNAEVGNAQTVNAEAVSAEEVDRAREGDAQRVRDCGGLFVIGTERHESRRIDNQLRGRSGRQGDPGCSRFFLSLEDDLMRIFGSERMKGMLTRLGIKEGEAISHRWVTKALEKAQQKVEGRNFEARKTLLRFDDVVNDQRRLIYQQRRDWLSVEELRSVIADMRVRVLSRLIDEMIAEGSFPEQWKIEELQKEFYRLFAVYVDIAALAQREGVGREEIERHLTGCQEQHMALKAADFGPEALRSAEKQVLLLVFDRAWKEHLANLEHLRHGIGLRAYAQRDPLNEYKREAFGLFDAMLKQAHEEVVFLLSHIDISRNDAAQEKNKAKASPRADPAHDAADDRAPIKVARKAPCPCGSGRKYKHCCGKSAEENLR